MIYSSASKLQRETRVITALFVALGDPDARLHRRLGHAGPQAPRHAGPRARPTPSGSRWASSPTSSTPSASAASPPSTTYFRLRKLVRDELIPGSLNVGYCLPTVTQAFSASRYRSRPLTLVLMIATAVAGSGSAPASCAHVCRARAIQSAWASRCWSPPGSCSRQGAPSRRCLSADAGTPRTLTGHHGMALGLAGQLLPRRRSCRSASATTRRA